MTAFEGISAIVFVIGFWRLLCWLEQPRRPAPSGASVWGKRLNDLAGSLKEETKIIGFSFNGITVHVAEEGTVIEGPKGEKLFVKKGSAILSFRDIWVVEEDFEALKAAVLS